MRSAVLLALAACATTHGRAESYFSEKLSCPTSTIAIGSVVPPLPAVPPDDVARDPARLAVWTSTRDHQRTRQSRFDWYALTGCGHQMIVRCLGGHDRLAETNLPASTWCETIVQDGVEVDWGRLERPG